MGCCNGGAPVDIIPGSEGPYGTAAFLDSPVGVIFDGFFGEPDLIPYTLTGSRIDVDMVHALNVHSSIFPGLTLYGQANTDFLGNPVCALNETTMLIAGNYDHTTRPGISVLTHTGTTLSITDLQLQFTIPVGGSPQYLARIDDTHFLRGLMGVTNTVDICELSGTTLSILNTTSVPAPSGPPTFTIGAAGVLGLLDATHAIAGDIGPGHGNLNYWVLEFDIATGITGTSGPFDAGADSLEWGAVDRAGGGGILTADVNANNTRGLIAFNWDGASLTFGPSFSFGIGDEPVTVPGHGSIGIAGGGQAGFGPNLPIDTKNILVFGLINASAPVRIWRVSRTGTTLTLKCQADIASTSQTDSEFIFNFPGLHTDSGLGILLYYDDVFDADDSTLLVGGICATGWYLNTIAMAA